ncbi:hypothetical protein BpHYR1_007519, partial [Brachionus plicatilis]
MKKYIFILLTCYLIIGVAMVICDLCRGAEKKLVGRPPKQERSEIPSGNKQRGPGIPKKMARREEICEMAT